MEKIMLTNLGLSNSCWDHGSPAAAESGHQLLALLPAGHGLQPVPGRRRGPDFPGLGGTQVWCNPGAPLGKAFSVRNGFIQRLPAAWNFFFPPAFPFLSLFPCASQ